MKDSIHSKVASALLQTPMVVLLGGKKYVAPHPTIGTIVMASDRINNLPSLELDSEAAVRSQLTNAKECAEVGEILAIFILGAKKIMEMNRRHRACFLFKSGFKAVEELGRKIMECSTPKEINRAFAVFVTNLDTSDFFDYTTFLQEIVLTKPTKVVEQTRSGQ